MQWKFKSKIFLKSQIRFCDFDRFWIFPPKARHRITWKWHNSKYPKSKPMDFQWFQFGKTLILAKFDKLKRQFC